MDHIQDHDNSTRRIFISYRREGGVDIARGLHDQLKSRGYSVFLDHESLSAGAFNQALYREIENCDVFLIILSEKSLDRCMHEGDWVRQELAHAIRCGKSIVPVMKDGFRFPRVLPREIEQIRDYHALRISYEFYDAFLERLEKFLWTDQKPLKREPDPEPAPKPDFKRLAVCVGLGAVVLLLIFLMARGCGPEPDPTNPSETDPIVTTDPTETDPPETDPTDPPETQPPVAQGLSGNTQTNLCNGGFITETHDGKANHMTPASYLWYNLFSEEDVFYYYDAESKSVRVQWKQDGKGLYVRLLQDVDCSYLYVTNEWLYCVLEENGTGTLYRAENRWDDHGIGELEPIVENVLSHNRVAIDGDSVYYWVRGEGLYKCRTDGSDPRLLYCNGSGSSHFGFLTFHVSDNYVYFMVSTGGIYAVNTEGGKAVHLVDTREHPATITHAVECGGKLYYTMEYQSENGHTAPAEIWCANLDGSDNHRVITMDDGTLEVRMINSVGDALYLRCVSGGQEALYALYAGADTLKFIHNYD